MDPAGSGSYVDIFVAIEKNGYVVELVVNSLKFNDLLPMIKYNK